MPMWTLETDPSLVADNSPFFRNNTERFQKHGTDFNYFNFGKIREQLFSIAMRMDMLAQIFAVLTFDKLWQPGARARLAFKYMHLEWSSVPIELSEKLDQLLFEMKWMLVK